MSGSGDVALCALSCTAITVPWDIHTCPPRREIPFLLLTVRFCAGKRLKCTLAQGTFGTRVWQGTSGTPPFSSVGGTSATFPTPWSSFSSLGQGEKFWVCHSLCRAAVTEPWCGPGQDPAICTRILARACKQSRVDADRTDGVCASFRATFGPGAQSSPSG